MDNVASHRPLPPGPAARVDEQVLLRPEAAEADTTPAVDVGPVEGDVLSWMSWSAAIAMNA